MKGLLSLDKDTLKTVITGVQEYALWVTLALFVVVAVAGIVVYAVKRDYFSAYKKIGLGVALGYSVTLIAVVMFLQITRMKVKGELDANFYLFVGFFFLIIALAVTGLILGKYVKKVYSYYAYIALAVVAIYFIVLLAVLPTAGSKYKPIKSGWYYSLSAILIVAIFSLAFVFGKDDGTASKTRQLAYAGVCVALSFALSYVKFFSMPMGGSVTLVSLLPLMIYSYVFGSRKGVFVGVLYGVLQCLQSPQIYEPMQVLLDYPIAFGAIGLTGIARKFTFLKDKEALKLALGMTIGVLFRYISHVLSGYFVFNTWSTMDSALAYSFAYNSFTLIDLLLDLVVGVLIMGVKGFRKAVLSVNPVNVENGQVADDTAVILENVGVNGEENTDGKGKTE